MPVTTMVKGRSSKPRILNTPVVPGVEDLRKNSLRASRTPYNLLCCRLGVDELSLFVSSIDPAVAKPNKALAEARTVLKKQLPKIEAAAIVGAATLTASPAFALVDKRLNGDGTRLPFGINDPILGWVLVAVFGAVWAVFSQSTKELGAGEEDGDDGGLSL